MMVSLATMEKANDAFLAHSLISDNALTLDPAEGAGPGGFM